MPKPKKPTVKKSTYVADKKHNKHGEVAAASFKRLAMMARRCARTDTITPLPDMAWLKFARALDAEAALIRKKR